MFTNETTYEESRDTILELIDDTARRIGLRHLFEDLQEQLILFVTITQKVCQIGIVRVLDYATRLLFGPGLPQKETSVLPFLDILIMHSIRLLA